MLKLNEFIELFEASVADIPKGSLRPDTDYKALASWDSLAILTVIDSTDEACGVLLKKADFTQSPTLKDLYLRICDSLNT